MSKIIAPIPKKMAYLANIIFILVSLAVFSNLPELSLIDSDNELIEFIVLSLSIIRLIFSAII